MNAKSVTVFAVIALTVFAGAAAAMPGSAPDAAGDENEMPGGTPADDAEIAANASAEAGDHGPAANASAHADGAPDRGHDARDTAQNESADGPAVDAPGPAIGMPEQAPDHVSEIHDLIRQFLTGDGEGSLGELVSDVVSADADTSGSANASANATAAP